jgi:hypothetical protein
MTENRDMPRDSIESLASELGLVSPGGKLVFVNHTSALQCVRHV